MGLLTRGPRKHAQVTVDDTRMSVIEHLEALRRGLIISAIAWILASIVAWFFTVEILQFLEHRAGVGTFTYLGPTGAFMLRFKIALFAGTFFASPIIIWQSWWFVSPGLRRLSNLMTPGADPLTPLIVFVPLVTFWGGVTLLLRFTGR